ncbi:ankyrin repeat domain-containing protein [Muricauda sp. CAU 1633]|uniref:ankyrin repeat domain-containing protein n=1 Tax=Allomuricauda sp. CAU 1633 TaxID=2816036 RepID=UPI001A8DC260|nr:ankyrin repeat domain-containing protein [Muricauda sp. CAU 1633]MBO0324195.1 ankyrin repeat domain-containing protein [Muricauda sp. CAU 1633]
MKDLYKKSEELINAIYDGDLVKVRGFAEKGVPLNAEYGRKTIDIPGESVAGIPYKTPLGTACSQGHLEIVKYLLGKGAKVDIQNYLTRTPFLEAVEACQKGIGSFNAIKELVAAGADAHFASPWGNAIHYAIGTGPEAFEMLKYLLELGIDPHVKDKKSHSVLRKKFFYLTELIRDNSKIGEMLLEQLKLLRLYWNNEDAEMKKLWRECLEALEANEAKKLKWESIFQNEDWVSQVSKKIESNALKSLKNLKFFEEITRYFLNRPEVIAHPDWGKLIQKISDMGPSSIDLIEQKTGKKTTVFSRTWYRSDILDEITEKHLFTADFCLEVLNHEKALERDDFLEIFTYVLKEASLKYGYAKYVYRENFMKDFFDTDFVKNHKHYNELQRIVAECNQEPS